ncbi:MAG: hypothetical protein GX557_10200 [Chloroflexi bacterium]|nr:hypothetical protein [Chloroflexota bacterium]
MPKSKCPACSEVVNVPGSPAVGHKVICPACAAELQVVWENPLELDWADYAEGEVVEIDDDDGAAPNGAAPSAN